MTDAYPKEMFLSEHDWQWVSKHMPIACVDILPVIQDGSGRLSRVGLIWRDSPMGERWCHVGGRIFYQETLLDAAQRHISDAIPSLDVTKLRADPYLINQYFPTPREGMGLDPRKHAVAACYLIDVEIEGTVTTVGTEAKSFKWFDAKSLPNSDQLWPGTERMVEKAFGEFEPQDELVSFGALNARYISHNELMWQTPALAMTAMAFLLTIALSGEKDWMRAVSASLSAIIACISAQLLAKHWSSQIRDADDLWAIEQRRGMLPVHAPPHYEAVGLKKGLRPWFVSKRSRVWWLNTMLIFAVVSGVIAVYLRSASRLGGLGPSARPESKPEQALSCSRPLCCPTTSDHYRNSRV